MTEDRTTPFELCVNDGGAGATERGGDQAMLWYDGETEENEPGRPVPGNFTPPQEDEYCGIEEDPTSKRGRVPALARGNNQVYDANPASPAPPASASARVRKAAAKSLVRMGNLL